MAVTLTEAAARHVTRYLAKRGRGVGVRLGVKTTGCSGLAYKLEYVDEIEPEDMVFEGFGVKVLIEPKSFAYLDGTELDFVREGLNEGFKFNNPKERDRCGCGESFRVESCCGTAMRRRARWERKGPSSLPVEILTYLKYVPVSARRAPSLTVA